MINMIPGMHEMARKLSLARVLNRLRELWPAQFAFYPRTWSLPLELDSFKQHCASTQGASPPPMYIVKPSAGSQGTGIYLASRPDQVQKHSAAVVQEYMHSPLLLDGFKFDMRCYVLVHTVEPLVAYFYKAR